MERKLDGFWWTWREGDDWPSWYYGQGAARDAVNRLARSSPGRNVSIGTIFAHKTVVLPDDLREVKTTA